MTPFRLIAIIGIFFCTMIAWFILGGSINMRTSEKTIQLGQRVENNWGGIHTQLSPEFYWYETLYDTTMETSTSANGQTIRQQRVTTRKEKRKLEVTRNDITADIKVDYRQKGLLWYSVYEIKFKGSFKVANTMALNREIFMRFDFPSQNSLYDDFVLTVNGQSLMDEGLQNTETTQDAYGQTLSQFLTAKTEFKPNEEKEFIISYRSQGTGLWQFSFGDGTKRVKNFSLNVATHFKEFDIPEFCTSPSEKTETADGWNLIWKYSDVISNIKIGIDMPKKLNPGPVAERISFFAPVSLLFFFTILIIIGAIQGNSIHPMNYFFLAAAFFAFHLLFAYLVDHLELEWSFVIASVTSVILVFTYMRLVMNMAFALKVVVPTQVIYLVLFSYSFFFEGYTGLTITIGAIVTLFVLMQMTAKIDWSKVFEKKS
ncbi:inner membrane CreD family protein [bacterium]|nr:inner membrane CreD family protein [bacterium]